MSSVPLTNPQLFHSVPSRIPFKKKPSSHERVQLCAYNKLPNPYSDMRVTLSLPIPVSRDPACSYDDLLLAIGKETHFDSLFSCIPSGLLLKNSLQKAQSLNTLLCCFKNTKTSRELAELYKTHGPLVLAHALTQARVNVASIRQSNLSKETLEQVSQLCPKANRFLNQLLLRQMEADLFSALCLIQKKVDVTYTPVVDPNLPIRTKIYDFLSNLYLTHNSFQSRQQHLSDEDVYALLSLTKAATRDPFLQAKLQNIHHNAGLPILCLAYCLILIHPDLKPTHSMVQSTYYPRDLLLISEQERIMKTHSLESLYII